MNINSLIPPVNPKLKTVKRSEIAVAGSETRKDREQQHQTVGSTQEKRKGKDRRQRNIKPLVDMRSGEDRRKNGKPQVNLNI